jgi:glycosyltransferase involved in cell wall biosynthesis
MASQMLRIVHCFRSPVGGIFRHVRDLIEAQVAEGHQVGILCDSITGGAFEEQLIRDVAPRLALGVHRVTMRRSILPSDLIDLGRTYALIRRIRPDVLHGHGAKGGAYARIVGSAMRLSGARPARLYTPHGGSMHYDPRQISGRLFFQLERLLERFSDHLLFVSQYEADAYTAKVGSPAVPARVVHNGLAAAEFVPVLPNHDAADFLYIGMLRGLKGPDLFVEAIAEIARSTDRPVSAVIVGDGPQRDELVRLAQARAPGLVTFHDPMPVRMALQLGRVMVLPSRAESLPYVVMEALAADRPVIAVDVGGVGEIIPRAIQPLVAPRDSVALAKAMVARLQAPLDNPKALRRHIRSRFSVENMAGETMKAYRRAMGDEAPAALRGPVHPPSAKAALPRSHTPKRILPRADELSSAAAPAADAAIDHRKEA